MCKYIINEITSFGDVDFQAGENIIYKDEVSNIYFLVKSNLYGKISLSGLLDDIKEINALFLITKPRQEFRWILFDKNELSSKKKINIDQAVENSDKYVLINGEYLKCCFFGKDPYVKDKDKNKSVIEAVREKNGIAETHPAMQNNWNWDIGNNLQNFKLVIGTFPVEGVEFYYSSPSNRFWPIIIGKIYGRELSNSSEKRRLLQEKNIILRDVIASCFRTNGSSDDGLVMTKSIACGEISNLVAQNPQSIIFTGSVAEKIFRGMNIGTVNINCTLALSPSRSSNRRGINDETLVKGWREYLAD